MLNKIVKLWKIKDLRNDILFVLAMLVVFRFAAHVPIPGINVRALSQFFESNQVLGMINIFSGGAMKNFSIVMLGVGPYITSSIIFQLLTMIVPKLEELSKEGESGMQKINQWTRYATFPLAILQSYGMITLLRHSSSQILPNLNTFHMIVIISAVTAGTMFLMWIGELISEKHVGNGISLIIFAGIVAGIPGAIQENIINYDPSKFFNLLVFTVIALVTIVAIVIINEGQRNIPVQYARQLRSNRMYSGDYSHLPLRVNQAGMIPIIFAISVILFPPMIAQFFIHAKSEFLRQAANWTIQTFQPGQFIYILLYFLLVVAFTFFYTFVIFHPQQIAENLQKQGAFIPGIRPGKPTANYLSTITIRIVFVGAVFLGLVALLPFFMQWTTHTQTLAISGASLLIVVGVVIESVKQIEARVTMAKYENI